MNALGPLGALAFPRSMLLPGIFGINNDGIDTAVKLLIVVVVVVWLALVYYTFADARRRIVDPMLVGCATAASLFPFVGTVVYMIVRPPEYLDDVRERELEMQAAEARLHSLNYFLCPHCDHEVEKEFLRCPNCMRKLKDPCVNCGKPLDPTWSICPYCEAEIPGVTPPPRRRRRRRSSSDELEAEATASYEAPPQ
jgi:double zinc ribbon protein